MNKKTKGAIAAGAAALLLAGGAGSFALWSDSETIPGVTVNSGTLTLTTQGTPAWQVNGAAMPANYLAVPGDVLTYNTTVTIGATGSNLEAELTVDSAAWATGSDADLVTALGTPSVTKTAGTVDLADVTSADDNETVGVAVSFTFDEDTAGTTAQAMDATLDSLVLKLQQK